MEWMSSLGEPLLSKKEIQKAVKETEVNEIAYILAIISEEEDKEMFCIIIKETFLHLLSSLGLAAFRLAIARKNPLIKNAFKNKNFTYEDLVRDLRLIAKSTKDQILEERSIIIDPPIPDAWEDVE